VTSGAADASGTDGATGEADDGGYPPPKHLLRDLALEVQHRDDGTSAAWLPVVPELLDDTGRVRAGVLATLVDVIGGGLAAQAAAPDWIATADLTLHLVRGVRDGSVEAVARVLRRGRTTVVIDVELRRGDDVVGVATMTFSVLPRRDTNPVITFAGGTPRTSFVVPGSGFAAPLLDEVGCRVVDAAAGVVELPVADYNRNSLGALQGGVVAMGIDVAAEAALRAACGTPVVVTDLQVTYLALVRGTLRTDTTVLHAEPAFGSATVDVLDAGSEARRTTTARVVATREDT
jgi:uncharacterized protein (TIGR00369 family)